MISLSLLLISTVLFLVQISLRNLVSLLNFFEKLHFIKTCSRKIRVRLRVRLQGPYTRLQKSVHVAALEMTLFKAV